MSIKSHRSHHAAAAHHGLTSTLTDMLLSGAAVASLATTEGMAVYVRST